MSRRPRLHVEGRRGLELVRAEQRPRSRLSRRSCDDLGVECGEVSDGCDGARYCGECEAPETCGGGGTDNFCGCPPEGCWLELYEPCNPSTGGACCPGTICRYYDIDPATGTYRYYCL